VRAVKEKSLADFTASSALWSTQITSQDVKVKPEILVSKKKGRVNLLTTLNKTKPLPSLIKKKKEILA
jgi:propanediol dehydratase small subunit